MVHGVTESRTWLRDFTFTFCLRKSIVIVEWLASSHSHDLLFWLLDLAQKHLFSSFFWLLLFCNCLTFPHPKLKYYYLYSNVLISISLGKKRGKAPWHAILGLHSQRTLLTLGTLGDRLSPKLDLYLYVHLPCPFGVLLLISYQQISAYSCRFASNISSSANHSLLTP